MTESKKPDVPPGDDDVYVIDETGDMEDVQELAGYRDTPVPADEEGAGGGPQFDRLREENEKLRDQLLRARAEFENFRRRAEREKADFFRYALADAFRELIPVLDSFERAMAVNSGAPEDFRQGIDMIQRQLSDTLTRSGLETIEPLGEPFDPKFHEAIARLETGDVEPNRVTDVLQKGYMLHDRLIRPAMVRVSVAPSESREGKS